MPARVLVALASLIVPRAERRAWTEEWHAELAVADWRLRHAWGALSDAWYLRVDGWTMGKIVGDLARGAKALARRPAFTALAGLTLAMGIGANTAIFSVVDSVLLNPLPYPESERILSVNHTAPGLNLPVIPYSEGMYLLYSEQTETLEALAVHVDANVNMLVEGEPQRLAAARVSTGYFDVLGVHPAIGRAFAEGEDRVGAEPLVILGHGVWNQTFGGDPSVVGRLVEMDGVRRRVVGVMPDGPTHPRDTEVWLPLEIDDREPDTGAFSMGGIARMKLGEDAASVRRELDALLLRFSDANAEDLPRELLAQAGMRSDAKPLKDVYVGDLAKSLWIVLGTVGFVLLIACANVANLFLVRAETRQREHALRTALGASPADMVRHDLTESVVLALGAGAIGLGLAAAGLHLLAAIAPEGLPRADEIGIDGTVLLYALVVSVLSGLLFGLFPAVGRGRRNVAGALKEGGRASTTGRERHRTRNALVVAQVALALVLLVGSGLMARSFAAVQSVDPGFDAASRLVFRVSLPSAEYPDPSSTRAFYRSLEERFEAIPGASRFALASSVPLDGNKSASSYEPSDRPYADGELGLLVDLTWVGPGYFDALGIELLEGRPLTVDDDADAARSVVVNERLARQFWPGEASVLGRRIQSRGDDAEGWEVVGVARDVRYESLTDDPEFMAYFPLVTGTREAPAATRALAVTVHTAGDPLAALPAVREALGEVDPRLPVVAPRTLASIVSDASATTSFTVSLLGIAAAIALLLGTVGIYGVISYVVSQRTQEIGVRMALGAPAGRVLGAVVRQGVVLAVVGVAVGLAGALGASRLLTSLLYGVSATDPLTYAATAGVLVLVAALASWMPARRAARVDPLEALRAD